MARDRDFEAGMGSAPTFEEKGSNARGGHTENDLVLGSQVIAEGVVEVGLASAPRPMKEEDVSWFIGDGKHDAIKGSLLIWVQVGHALVSICLLYFYIVSTLLLDEAIAQMASPVSNHLWHGVPILQALASIR